MDKYKKITAVEAKKIMDSESDIIILDVRTEEEREEGYIFESICIPLEEIEYKAKTKLKDKSKKILVYCQSGKRSMQACEILADMGYKNVYDFGGILDWNFEIVI